jgi:hypothetical protein
MNQKQIIARAAGIEMATQARGIVEILSQESYHSRAAFIYIL